MDIWLENFSRDFKYLVGILIGRDKDTLWTQLSELSELSQLSQLSQLFQLSQLLDVNSWCTTTNPQTVFLFQSAIWHSAVDRKNSF